MTEQIKKPGTLRSLSTVLRNEFVALSVLSLLIYGGWQLFFFIQNQQEIISNKQQLIAQDAASTVKIFFQDKFNVLSTTVILSSPVMVSPEEQSRILDNLLGLQPTFQKLVLLDAQDSEVAQASRVLKVATGQLTDRLEVDALAQIRQGQRYISPIYINEATGEPMLIMAIPMINALGDFQGTIMAEVNLKFMWDLVDQLKVGQTGYAYMVDTHGNLIAFSDTARVLKAENVSKLEVVSDYILHPTSLAKIGASIYTGIKGTSVVGTFVPLEAPKWAVVTELPWQEAYRDVIRVVGVSIGIILGLAILAGLLGFFTARSITIPLINLTETAAAIAAGDMERKVIVKSRNEVGALASAFNSMTDQLKTLVTNLEERASERTRVLEKRSLELQTVALIARDVSIAQETEDILINVTRLIRERFGFYHVGAFLIDEKREYAVLRAAGGDAGQLMLENKHRLKIGETGIVGYVAQSGEARIALDVGTDAVHFRNPLLPYTRSEMALPLKIRGRIIGVLDIQSDKVNAFDQNDITIMEILTDQLAVSIERTRLLQELEQNAVEMERSAQENVARNWRLSLQRGSKHQGYRYEGIDVEPITKPSPGNLDMANMETSSFIRGGSDKKGGVLAVPIRLRGQALGILNLQFQIDKVPSETIKLVEQASDRLALALENARLIQDAQRLATREQQINQISTQVQQSTDLESVLQNTIRELGNTLGVPRTFIQIGLLPSEDKKTKL